MPRAYWIAAAAVAAALLLWQFGPAIARMITFWNTEPDYSHGFLVAPFAVLLCWLRRDTFPKDSVVPGWAGLTLLVAGYGVGYAAERLFLTPLAGWAFVLWVAGAWWLVAGTRAFRWALPGIVFLLFMIPLPFRVEQAMSWNLQSIATYVSTFILQCLGLPAIAEGHTIVLGDQVLEIEQACSGLRVFMGISAVAYAFIVLNRRPWWERVILVLAVAPIAIVSNSLRVVATGLLMQIVSGEAAARFSHDAAGWAMIVVAAAMFGLLVAYLRRLIVAVDLGTGRDLLKGSALS
ncbi:MAG: exosortase [Planctomycetaceae bacterium]